MYRVQEFYIVVQLFPIINLGARVFRFGIPILQKFTVIHTIYFIHNYYIAPCSVTARSVLQHGNTFFDYFLVQVFLFYVIARYQLSVWQALFGSYNVISDVYLFIRTAIFEVIGCYEARWTARRKTEQFKNKLIYIYIYKSVRSLDFSRVCSDSIIICVTFETDFLARNLSKIDIICTKCILRTKTLYIYYDYIRISTNHTNFGKRNIADNFQIIFVRRHHIIFPRFCINLLYDIRIVSFRPSST